MSSLDWNSCHKSKADAEILRGSETFLRLWRVWGSTGSDGAVRLRLKVRTFLCGTPDRTSVLAEDTSSVMGPWCVKSGALPELQKDLSVVQKKVTNFGAVWKSVIITGSDTARDVPAPRALRVVPNPAGSECLTCCVLCEASCFEQVSNEVLVFSRRSERLSRLGLHNDVSKAFCNAALELDSHSNEPRFDWDFWNVSNCPLESPLGLWDGSLERLRTDRSVLGEPQSGVSSVTPSSSTPISSSFLTTGPGTVSGEAILHFTLDTVQVCFSASHT